MNIATIADFKHNYAAQALSVQRQGRFDVSFCHYGGKTRLKDQYISYPFHMTRPFYLDASIPELVTLYQQSSSGGLYQNDRLGSSFRLAENTAAYVTTQAATLVHHCHDSPCYQTVDVRGAEGSFFIYAPDSTIVFPGACLENRINITMSEQACMFIHESFTWYNPSQATSHSRGTESIFNRLSSQLHVRDEAGGLIVRDAFQLLGSDIVSQVSPVADWSLCSTFLLLGREENIPPKEDVKAMLQLEGQTAGVSSLPNGAGFFVRSLSKTAAATKILVDRLAGLMARSYFGSPLAVRRK